MDFSGMLNDVVGGVMGVVNALALSGDYTVLAMAAIVIILAALMSPLEQIVSSTMMALFAYVVLGVVWAAYKAEWDFATPVNGAWASFAGTADAVGFSFFHFAMYFIVFAIAIGIVNILKGMVSG